jgi:hypothetical protein
MVALELVDQEEALSAQEALVVLELADHKALSVQEELVEH